MGPSICSANSNTISSFTILQEVVIAMADARRTIEVDEALRILWDSRRYSSQDDKEEKDDR